MPDGSSTDEFFESDNDAIAAATEANLGASCGIRVQRYTEDGRLYPTHLPEGGHQGTVRRYRPKPQVG